MSIPQGVRRTEKLTLGKFPECKKPECKPNLVANTMYYFGKKTFKLWFNNHFMYYPTFPLGLKLNPNMLNHVSNMGCFLPNGRGYRKKNFIKKLSSL